MSTPDPLLSPLATKDSPSSSIGGHCSMSSSNPGTDNPLKDGLGRSTSPGDGSKPRIWSLADVATSSSPSAGRRSPMATLSTGAHALGLSAPTHLGGAAVPGGPGTAFTAPTPNTPSGFQPWVPGSSYPNASHPGNPGLAYSYPLSHHPMGGSSQLTAGSTATRPTPSLAGPGGLGGGGHLPGLASSSFSSKLSNGFLGEAKTLELC